MGRRGALKQEVAFLVPAVVAVEVLWLGSLDYVLQHFGPLGLAEECSFMRRDSSEKPYPA